MQLHALSPAHTAPSPDAVPNLAQKADALERLQLRMMLAARLATLELQVRECSALEDALSRFAAEYFSALGEQARVLCSLLAPQEHRRMDATSNELHSHMRELATARTARLKDSYRKLARNFHPDTTTNSTDTSIEIMQAVNAAYSQRDMATLLRLEIEHLVGGAQGDYSTNALAEKLARCEALIGNCVIEREAMEQSPLFVLHERTMLARLAGEDFIQSVLSGMQAQIRVKQRAGNKYN